MKLMEALRKRNRTLVEMYIGMLVFGIVCQMTGVLFVTHRLVYALSLWLGVCLAMLAAWHMYRSLDHALDLGEAAVKLVFRDYLIRYALLTVILLVIIVTDYLNPLVVVLGYMALKITVYLQPFVHKLCDRIFPEKNFCEKDSCERDSHEEDSHVTDSISQSLEENKSIEA